MGRTRQLGFIYCLCTRELKTEIQTEDLLCERHQEHPTSASPQPPKRHNSPEVPGELSPREVVPIHHPDVGTRQHQEARFLMKNCPERLWHTGTIYKALGEQS